MKTRTLIGTALLLSTAGLGVALAATQIDHLDLPFHSSDPAAHALRLSDNDHRRAGKERQHDDDDDDDDSDGRQGQRPGPVPQNRPADPTSPVPDNGLFQGKAPPKVEVQ